MKPTAPNSKIMTELYGADYAAQVATRLEELDPELNKVIQSVAYDQLWSREGLSLRDKSLVTVAALIAMGKEEQTKIHMTGFLNSGGQLDDLRATLIHLATYCGFPATMNGFAALRGVLESGNTKPTIIKTRQRRPRGKKR